MFEALTSRLYDEFRRMWLYRWFMVAATTISFLIIAGAAVSLPKMYDAWSEIYVDKLAVMSAATDNVSFHAATNPSSVMVDPKVLLNDDRLRATLIKINPETANLSPKGMLRAVEGLRGAIEITKVDESGFIQFHAKDTDPVRAARIAQELTSQFIDVSLSRINGELGVTTRFLDGQIETYRGLLADSQQQLANYRRAHPGLALEGGFDGPATTGDDFVTVTAPSVSVAPAAPVVAAPRTYPEDRRISQLEEQLSNLLTQYTDQHPDVINTRRELANLLRSRAAAAAVPVAVAPVAAAPVVQGATQVVRRGGRRAAAVPPNVAAEWGTLLANNEALRTDYQQLISRQQATQMSAAVLGSSKQFEIIRPVTVPLVSYMPSRSLMVVLSAIAAVMIGLVLTFARAAISGVLVSPRELEEEFDLPVAATVSWEPAWQTGQVSRVDPRFIPPFLRSRVARASNVRLVGHDAR